MPVSYAKPSNSLPECGMTEKIPYVRRVSYLRTQRSTSLQGVFTAMFSEFGTVLLLSWYRIFSLNSLAPNIPVLATSAQVSLVKQVSRIAKAS